MNEFDNSIFKDFDNECIKVIMIAQEKARQMRHKEVSIPHFLYAASTVPSKIKTLLNKCHDSSSIFSSVYFDKYREDEDIPVVIEFSSSLKSVLMEAHYKKLKENVTLLDILVALNNQNFILNPQLKVELVLTYEEEVNNFKISVLKFKGDTSSLWNPNNLISSDTSKVVNFVDTQEVNQNKAIFDAHVRDIVVQLSGPAMEQVAVFKKEHADNIVFAAVLIARRTSDILSQQ